MWSEKCCGQVAVKTSTRSTGTEDLEREARVFMKLPARQKLWLSCKKWIWNVAGTWTLSTWWGSASQLRLTCILFSCWSFVRWVSAYIICPIDWGLFVTKLEHQRATANAIKGKWCLFDNSVLASLTISVQGNLEKLLQKNKEDFLPPDTKHLKVKFFVSHIKGYDYEQLQFQIISESGQLNSKLLVKYSYQVLETVQPGFCHRFPRWKMIENLDLSIRWAVGWSS